MSNSVIVWSDGSLDPLKKHGSHMGAVLQNGADGSPLEFTGLEGRRGQFQEGGVKVVRHRQRVFRQYFVLRQKTGERKVFPGLERIVATICGVDGAMCVERKVYPLERRGGISCHQGHHPAFNLVGHVGSGKKHPIEDVLGGLLLDQGIEIPNVACRLDHRVPISSGLQSVYTPTTQTRRDTGPAP